jgi:hypothetical protein
VVVVGPSTVNQQTTAIGGLSSSFPTASASSTSGNSSGTDTGSGSLTPAGKVAIGVIVPLAAVAGLILAAVFFLKRRSRRREDEEKRNEEMAAYAYNPNNDPTLPAVALKDETAMSDDGPVGAPGGGYRGWGPTGSAAAASAGVGSLGRKTSTNASGNTYNQGPVSPGLPEVEGDNSYGAGLAAGGLHRGPSNASSTYSHGEGSRHSTDYPGQPYITNQHYPPQGPVQPGQAQEYQPYSDYYQPGPYDYGGQQPNGPGGPVIRDNPARRLTQIQEGQIHSGHGGIAQNF